MNPPRSGLSLGEYRALALFRHLIRRFLAFSRKAASSAGLHPQQHQLLLALTGLPSGEIPTIGVLAWHLQMRHQSAVELVDRLSRRGLARRDRNPRDRRQVLVSITAQGRRKLRELSVQHREELRKLGPELLRALQDLFGPNRGRGP